MRNSFEKIITGYNEVAKDRLEGNVPSGDEIDLDDKLARLVRDAHARRGSVGYAQENIYVLQEQKQQIVQELHEKFAQLDNPDYEAEAQEGELPVTRTAEGYVARMSDGESLPVTKGEIMTDMDWGLRYHLDASVDRSVRKRYLLEDAKRRIGALLDEQITEDETASRFTSEWKREAYRKRGLTTGEETGFLAERMVKSYLEKLSFDLDVDFEIEESDAYQDVKDKIDFIVRRKERGRGVTVEESEKVVGVQFTTDTRPETIAHKQDQINAAKDRMREEQDDDIQDIVLVQVQPENVREVYETWKENPRPGGPDKLWSQEMKREVFGGVMHDILEPDEIAQQWSVMSGEEPGNTGSMAAAA